MQRTVAEKGVESAIFEEIAGRGPTNFEELLRRLPTYGWNQIFAAVDRLSREGRLSIRRIERDTYLVMFGPRWEDH
jgi:hypothetical protein